MLTLIITILTGVYVVISIIYYKKTKKYLSFFQHQGLLSIIVSFIVCAIGVYALIKGLAITDLISFRRHT